MLRCPLVGGLLLFGRLLVSTRRCKQFSLVGLARFLAVVDNSRCHWRRFWSSHINLDLSDWNSSDRIGDDWFSLLVC